MRVGAALHAEVCGIAHQDASSPAHRAPPWRRGVYPLARRSPRAGPGASRGDHREIDYPAERETRGLAVSRAEQLDTQSSLDAQRFSEYERLFDRAWMLEQCSARISRPGLRVCDVGGATGVFLDSLARRASHPFEGTVLTKR